VIAVEAVAHDRPARHADVVGLGHQLGGDLQLRAEVRVSTLLGEACCRGVRLGVQRIVDPLVGPDRGHRDDAVVGLAIAAQPLPTDMRGAGAVLPIAGVGDGDHATSVRRGRRIDDQQLETPPVDLIGIPCGLRKEVLQPLHRCVLRPLDWLGPGQSSQSLIAITRGQQAG
jgi:hypothetical protein